MNLARPEDQKGTVRLMVWFLVFAAVVILAAALVMFLAPLDSGVLAPGNNSANLQYGGRLVQADALLYFAGPSGGLYLKNGEETKKLFDGDCHSLNAVDDWVYFVHDGAIVRTPQYGFVEEMVLADAGAKALSVNGSYLYYADEAGTLYKMKTDGSQHRAVSPDGVAVGRFAVDNRTIVYQVDGKLYQMTTDGKSPSLLVDSDCGMFLYTNDGLYYQTGGKIERNYSLMGKVDVSQIPYTPPPGEVFNYSVTSRETLLYTFQEDGIYVQSLPTLVNEGADAVKICAAEQADNLYLAGDTLYFYANDGTLYTFAAGLPSEEGKLREAKPVELPQ